MQRAGLFLAFIGGLGLMALGAQAQERTVPPPLKGVKRIVMLGDSITQGGESPGGYVWLVRTYLNKLYPTAGIEVLNAGISGHKSTDMLARFQKDVLDKKPDLITISVGVNDVWHGYFDFANNRPIPEGDGPNGITLDAYTRNVEEMIRRGKAAGAKIVVLSTTVIYEDAQSKPNISVAGYNAALKRLAKKHGAGFVDFQKPFQKIIAAYRGTTGARDNLLTTDGVHMNAAGNKVMAYTVLQGLGITPEDREAVRGSIEEAQRK
jgi:acyl-CoA thioesterase I